MAEYWHKITTFVDLQILQAADERHEAELYQKDEEIRQKNTQLEVTLGGNRSSTLPDNIYGLLHCMCNESI